MNACGRERHHVHLVPGGRDYAMRDQRFLSCLNSVLSRRVWVGTSHCSYIDSVLQGKLFHFEIAAESFHENGIMMACLCRSNEILKPIKCCN